LNANSAVPRKDGFLPKRFKVLIQGFGGPYYEVHFINNRLLYRARYSDLPVKICPTEDQWVRFSETVNKCHLWNWESCYYNSEVLDGIQWRVEIEIGTRTIKSFGSNSYPGGKGMGYSKSFRLFLGAIRELIGGMSFG
jgi:hypothetical protein